MTTFWACSCGETGSYAWADIKTTTDAASPEAKHQKTCGGDMQSSTSREALARVVARMGARL